MNSRFIHITFLVFVLSPLLSRGQNRPLLEFSTAVSVTWELNKSEPVPSFPTTINYVFNPRLTAGVNFIVEGMPTLHKRTHYQYNLAGQLEHVYPDDEPEDDWYVGMGMGVNLKYNFVVTSLLKLYAQVQANYLNLSIDNTTDGERQWTTEDNSGNEIHTYTSDPLPFEGTSALTYNLNLGADVAVSKNVSLYLQYDFRDIFKTLDIYYDIDVYLQSRRTSDGIEYNETQDVRFVDAKEKTSPRTVHCGIRIYLFDRKF